MWRNNQKRIYKNIYLFLQLPFLYTNVSMKENIWNIIISGINYEKKRAQFFSIKKGWIKFVKFLRHIKLSVCNLFIRNKLCLPWFLFFSFLLLTWLYVLRKKMLFVPKYHCQDPGRLRVFPRRLIMMVCC